MLAFGSILIIYPKLTEVPEVTIIDVSNMDVTAAEKALKDLGLNVSNDITYKSSNTIDKGKVISTDPVIGRTVKKGKLVSLVVSTGQNGIALENYIGKNYYEIKGSLEKLGIKINVETEEVTEDNKINENTIIAQDPKAGTIISEGESITLTIPDVVTLYPDFVGEGWTYDKVVEFCTSHDVSVQKIEKQTNDYPEGTIIAQGRKPGMRVTSPYTLSITVAIPMPIEGLNDEG